MVNSTQTPEETTLPPLVMVPHDVIVRRLTRGICKHLEGVDVDFFANELPEGFNSTAIIKQDRALFDERLATLRIKIRKMAEEGGLYFNRKPISIDEIQPVVDKWLSTYAIDEMHLGISMYKDAFEYGAFTLNNLCMAKYLYDLYLTIAGPVKAEELLNKSLRSMIVNPSTGALTWNWLRDEVLSRIFQGASFGANKLPVGTLPHSVAFFDTSARTSNRISQHMSELPVYGKLYQTVDKDTGAHVSYNATHLRVLPQRMIMLIADCGLSRRYVRMLEHKVNKIPGFSLTHHHYKIDRSNIGSVAGNTSSSITVTSDGVTDEDIRNGSATGVLPVSQSINMVRGGITKVAPDYAPADGEAVVIGLIMGYDRDRIDALGIVDEELPPNVVEGINFNREVWALVKRALPASRGIRNRPGVQGAQGINVLNLYDQLLCPDDIIKVIEGMMESSRTLGVFSPCQLI